MADMSLGQADISLGKSSIKASLKIMWLINNMLKNTRDRIAIYLTRIGFNEKLSKKVCSNLKTTTYCQTTFQYQATTVHNLNCIRSGKRCMQI
jgi:hypothetical protein